MISLALSKSVFLRLRFAIFFMAISFACINNAFAQVNIGLSPAEGALTAEYGVAYSQRFIASGTTGPCQYSLAGALPSGIAFDGETLSGIATSPGSYDFAITATDTSISGGSASITRNYSLVVAAPTIELSPTVLPNLSAGNTASYSLSANGGVAPYIFQIINRPSNLIANVFGTTLHFGPTQQTGSYSFTLVATDAYGQSGSRNYTVDIVRPTLSITPTTFPGGMVGISYDAAFQVGGSLNLFPANVWIASGNLPPGLSIACSNTKGCLFSQGFFSIRGIPTTPGTYRFTLTATDSTIGDPGVVSIETEITIVAPTLVLAPAAGALPDGVGGTPYSQTFVASGGTSPYAFDLATGALPLGLVLNTTTGTLSGTPAAIGSFNFSIRATDSTLGATGAATNTYTLTISAPSITINPQVLPDGMFGVPYSTVLTAVGGTAPHTFAVTAGALPTGVILDSNGHFSGSPSSTGSFSFTVTATDALGFTGARMYTIAAVDRPDPARDPDVRGLLDAQVESTRRFAATQIGNFQQRLERLHESDRRDGGMAYHLTFESRQRCIEQIGRLPDDHCVIANTPTMAREGDSGSHAFEAWVGGAIRSGNTDGRGGGKGAGFETDGVSAGIDYRFDPRLAFGGGIGFGRDVSKIGSNGARIDGKAYAGAIYASYRPGETFFLDSLVGYQRLDLDLRRTIVLTGNRVRAQRDAAQWFASLSAGADLRRDAWKLTPYGRIDLLRASLGAYAEIGDPMFALRYETMDVDTTTGTVGVRIEYRNLTRWGSFSPQLRLEYQHDYASDANAVLRYADLIGATYRATVDGSDRNRFAIGLGALFQIGSNWAFRTEYRGQLGGDTTDQSVTFSVEKSY